MTSAGNYQVTGTDANGCQGTANTSVTMLTPLVPSVSITASSNPSTAGSFVFYNATPTNGGSNPTYQWYVNNIAIAGQTTNFYSYMPTNGDVIKAVLISNESCVTTATATSNTITMNIPLVAPSILYFAVSSNTYGDASPVTLSAPGSNSTGAFTFTSSNPAVATVSGNLLTIVGAGSSTITATQAAAGNYTNGSVTYNYTVFKALPVFGTFGNITKTFGDPSFTLTPPTSNSPGAFTYVSNDTNIAKINGNVVTIVGVGTTSIAAIQAATNNYYGGSAFSTLKVNCAPVTPSIVLGANSNPTTGGLTVYFYTTPTNGGTSPTYQWYKGNTPIAGATSNFYTYVPYDGDVIKVVMTSNASCLTTTTATSNAITMSVTPVSPGISFNPGFNYYTDASPKTLKATSPSSGAFTYTSSNPAVATINGDQLTIVGAGVSLITATQAASGYYTGESRSVSYSVFQVSPTIGVFNSITKTFGDAPFTITPPTTNSPGAISYSSSDNNVATVNGNQITIVGVGTATIYYNQAGTTNFFSGFTNTTLTVNSAAPTITSFSPGLACPGTTVTITGTNFTGATAVTIGGIAVSSFNVVDATTITAVAGTTANGTIAVTTSGGSVTSTDAFASAATSSTTTISNCGSLTWNGTTYTTSGTYTKTLVNSAGCDSVATLVLTIPAEVTASISPVASVCSNSSVALTATLSEPNKAWIEWSNANGVIKTVNSGEQVMVNPTTTTIYTATVKTEYIYNYTGSNQTYTVPNGVTSINVELYGAAGQGLSSGREGKGGKVSATLAVTPGDVLNLNVGSIGDFFTNTSSGASDIRINSTDLNNRAIVAGAGGSLGFSYFGDAVSGGDGGGLIGQSGGTGLSGNGGTQTEGGSTGTDGDAGGSYGSFGKGGVQSFNYVVDFEDNTTQVYSAGGDGYYGGASGNAIQYNGWSYDIAAGGGGGGSSYTDPAVCSNVVHTQGANSGNGFIKISLSTVCPGPAQTVVVNVNQPTTSSTTVSNCGSYTWNGTTYSTSGTYTKTGLTNAAGCDSTATLELTINQPSTSSTTASNCGSYTWNGTSYTTSGTYTKTGLTNAAGCDSTATLVLTITPCTNTWTGVTSTDWNNASNWSAGTVPTASLDAVIANTVRKPVISGTVNVKNVTIGMGASLTVNGTLNVSGNWVNNGVPTLSGNGTVVLQSSSAATLSGYTIFSNLEVAGNYSVGPLAADNILVDSIAITGILKKTSGSLTTNGKVTLKSTASKTALIQEGSGTLSGRINMERYIGGANGYHHISSPVTNNTVGNWGKYFSIVGVNNIATSAAGSKIATLQEYRESANKKSILDSGFYHFTNPSAVTTSGKGLTAWLNKVPTTLVSTGTPANGNINVPVTFAATNATTKGWNLIGNPYPSPISWSALRSSNPGVWGDQSCYIWKATKGVNGQWQTYNGTVGTNGVGNVIASSQAFFVLVNQSTNLTFNNSIRTTDVNPTFFGTAQLKQLRLQIVNPANLAETDEVVAYTKAGIAQPVASVKPPMPGEATNASLSFVHEGKQAAIEALADFKAGDELALNISTPVAGMYLLKVGEYNHNLPAYLKDAKTGSYTELKAGAEIAVATEATTSNTRYSVVFGRPAAAVAAANNAYKVFAAKKTIQVTNAVAVNNAKVVVYNTLGQQITTATMNGTSLNIPVSASTNATYVVKIAGGTVAKVIVP